MSICSCNSGHLCLFSMSSKSVSALNLLRRLAITAFFFAQSSHALAAEFVTANNISISGEIVRFDSNLIAIQPSVGSLINLPRSDINLVRFSLNDGSIIEGPLIEWLEGTYTIKVDDRLTSIKNDSIISEIVAENSDLTETPVEPEATEIRTDEGRALSVITELGLVDVIVDVEATPESSPTIVFDISLSKQLNEDIVLFYTTIDGTAESGLDFEKDSGVIIFPPGKTEEKLPIDVIDDNMTEVNETFSLFLGTCSNMSTRRQTISAVIEDDDGS